MAFGQIAVAMSTLFAIARSVTVTVVNNANMSPGCRGSNTLTAFFGYSRQDVAKGGQATFDVPSNNFGIQDNSWYWRQWGHPSSHTGQMADNAGMNLQVTNTNTCDFELQASWAGDYAPDARYSLAVWKSGGNGNCVYYVSRRSDAMCGTVNCMACWQADWASNQCGGNYGKTSCGGESSSDSASNATLVV